MRYCDECEYLKPKEHEQTDKKEPHICNAYRRLLFHRGRHPRIPTPDYCIINKIDEEIDEEVKDNYIIVNEENTNELARIVNMRIKEGYICQGGITITGYGSRLQPMVLKIESSQKS